MVKPPILVTVLLVSGLIFAAQVRPQEVVSAKMVAIPPAGESDYGAHYVGETVIYRIYYSNTSQRPLDLGILTRLDTDHSQVIARGDATYDLDEHAILWKITDLTPGAEGSVEFQAVANQAKRIQSEALIQIGGHIAFTGFDLSAPNVTRTNVVQVDVCERPRTGWVRFMEGSEPGDLPRSYMKEESSTGLTINFDIPGMFVDETAVGNATYQRLSIPRHATRMDIGKPDLPTLGEVVEVPLGVAFQVEVVKSSSVNLQCYNVHPAQQVSLPLPDQNEPSLQPQGISIDWTTYAKEEAFPSALAEIQAEDVGVIRGHRLVFVKVTPVQVNPVTRRLKAFSNIEIRLNYSHPAQVQALDERTRHAAFEEMLGRTVMNYKLSSRLAVQPPQGDWSEGAEYLIITHSRFYDESDPNNPIVRLRRWKQRKGITTRVVELADIGSSASDVQDFIRFAYETWSPRPAYVLLVGDTGDSGGTLLLPTNYGEEVRYDFLWETHIGTDLDYATVDGAD